MSDLFDCEYNQAQVIANYLPNGELFEAKNIQGSIYRLFLQGLGQTNQSVASFICLFADEIDINTTELFLKGWEETLGIPDSCFSGTGTLQERRRDVLVKLASLGVQTAEDFEAVALIFGFVVNVYSQAEVVPNNQDAKYTIVVQYFLATANVFTLYFPIYFGDPQINILVCLFNKLKPANCRIIYTNGVVGRAFSSGFSSGFS